MSIFQIFHRDIDDAHIHNVFQKCRISIHRWEMRNRNTFDAIKEHLIIIHPQQCSDITFKLLGILIDPKLLMHDAVDAIISKMRSKIKILLRLRSYYYRGILIIQFNKKHIG